MVRRGSSEYPPQKKGQDSGIMSIEGNSEGGAGSSEAHRIQNGLNALEKAIEQIKAIELTDDVEFAPGEKGFSPRQVGQVRSIINPVEEAGYFGKEAGKSLSRANQAVGPGMIIASQKDVLGYLTAALEAGKKELRKVGGEVREFSQTSTPKASPEGRDVAGMPISKAIESLRAKIDPNTSDPVKIFAEGALHASIKPLIDSLSPAAKNNENIERAIEILTDASAAFANQVGPERTDPDSGRVRADVLSKFRTGLNRLDRAVASAGLGNMPTSAFSEPNLEASASSLDTRELEEARQRRDERRAARSTPAPEQTAATSSTGSQAPTTPEGAAPQPQPEASQQGGVRNETPQQRYENTERGFQYLRKLADDIAEISSNGRNVSAEEIQNLHRRAEQIYALMGRSTDTLYVSQLVRQLDKDALTPSEKAMLELVLEKAVENGQSLVLKLKSEANATAKAPTAPKAPATPERKANTPEQKRALSAKLDALVDSLATESAATHLFKKNLNTLPPEQKKNATALLSSFERAEKALRNYRIEGHSTAEQIDEIAERVRYRKDRFFTYMGSPEMQIELDEGDEIEQEGEAEREQGESSPVTSEELKNEMLRLYRRMNDWTLANVTEDADPEVHEAALLLVEAYGELGPTAGALLPLIESGAETEEREKLELLYAESVQKMRNALDAAEALRPPVSPYPKAIERLTGYISEPEMSPEQLQELVQAAKEMQEQFPEDKQLKSALNKLIKACAIPGEQESDGALPKRRKRGARGGRKHTRTGQSEQEELPNAEAISGAIAEIVDILQKREEESATETPESLQAEDAEQQPAEPAGSPLESIRNLTSAEQHDALAELVQREMTDKEKLEKDAVEKTQKYNEALKQFMAKRLAIRGVAEFLTQSDSLNAELKKLKQESLDAREKVLAATVGTVDRRYTERGQTSALRLRREQQMGGAEYEKQVKERYERMYRFRDRLITSPELAEQQARIEGMGERAESALGKLFNGYRSMDPKLRIYLTSTVFMTAGAIGGSIATGGLLVPALALMGGTASAIFKLEAVDANNPKSGWNTLARMTSLGGFMGLMASKAVELGHAKNNTLEKSKDRLATTDRTPLRYLVAGKNSGFFTQFMKGRKEMMRTEEKIKKDILLAGLLGSLSSGAVGAAVGAAAGAVEHHLLPDPGLRFINNHDVTPRGSNLFDNKPAAPTGGGSHEDLIAAQKAAAAEAAQSKPVVSASETHHSAPKAESNPGSAPTEKPVAAPTQPEAPKYEPLDVKVRTGRGADQMFYDIRAKYAGVDPNDPKLPPAIKHILQAKNENQLSRELNFINKEGQSAVIEKGSSISLNSKGEIVLVKLGGDPDKADVLIGADGKPQKFDGENFGGARAGSPVEEKAPRVKVTSEEAVTSKPEVKSEVPVSSGEGVVTVTQGNPSELPPEVTISQGSEAEPLISTNEPLAKAPESPVEPPPKPAAPIEQQGSVNSPDTSLEKPDEAKTGPETADNAKSEINVAEKPSESLTLPDKRSWNGRLWVDPNKSHIYTGPQGQLIAAGGTPSELRAMAQDVAIETGKPVTLDVSMIRPDGRVYPQTMTFWPNGVGTAITISNDPNSLIDWNNFRKIQR